MRKSIFTAAVVALIPFCSNAQFVIENTSGETSTANGNVRFSQTEEGEWQFAGTPLSDIKSISRAPHTGVVELDRDIVVDGTPCSIYFGDNYASEALKGVGNYYVELANDNMTVSGVDNIPVNIGGYRVILDIYGPLAANHNFPVIPEGTYTLTTRRYTPWSVWNGLTWAIHNTDGTYGGLKELYIDGGQIQVSHVDNVYDITGDLVLSTDESFKIHYYGPISFLDCSGIDDDENEQYIVEDVEVEPVVVNDVLYPTLSTDEYDEHVLRLFSTDNIDDEGNHCMEPGVKLQISFISGKDGIEGEYTFGELNGWTLIDPQPGTLYPGIYMGSIAANTFLELVADNLAVKTAIIKSGTLSIVKNSDGTHTIKADFESSNPASGTTHKATCNWTGVIDMETGASEAPARMRMLGMKRNHK